MKRTTGGVVSAQAKAIAHVKEFAMAYGDVHMAMNALHMEHANETGDTRAYNAAAGSAGANALEFVHKRTDERLRDMEDFLPEQFLRAGRLLLAIARSRKVEVEG